MTVEEKKGIVSVTALNGLIFAMAVPDVSLRVLRLMLPFLPLIAYCLVAIVIWKKLWKPFDKGIEHKEFDRQQAASLTLTGFCFTSLSMLASFFKEDIKSHNQQPLNVMFFFSCALVAFVGSYTLLRSRKRLLMDFLSEGLLDTGVWCILAGMWAFFRLYGPSNVSRFFLVTLVIFAFFILRNIYEKVKIY
jgi:hypothetical protein